jgi:TM2 domain-containing membrane protein YozV
MTLYKGYPVYNRLTVFVISILFGGLGIDRIYIKEYMTGLLKFITFGGFGIWYFLDIFHLALGKKIGSNKYYWTCELPNSKMNCDNESKMIKTSMLYLVIFLFLFFMYIYPWGNMPVLKKDDPYKDSAISNS